MPFTIESKSTSLEVVRERTFRVTSRNRPQKPYADGAPYGHRVVSAAQIARIASNDFESSVDAGYTTQHAFQRTISCEQSSSSSGARC